MFHHIILPGWCHVRIRRVQISRCLGPPRARAPAIVTASAGSGRCSHGATLAVQRSTSQLQLLPVHLLLFVTQQLIHQHTREYAGQYTGHRDTEKSPQAIRKCAVHRIAVSGSLKQHSGIPFRWRCSVTCTRSELNSRLKSILKETYL